MKHLNIEPFHFGAEEIFSHTPDIEKIRATVASNNVPECTYNILLDDTRTPGIPVEEDKARAICKINDFIPTVFINETDLTPIALALLVRLPDEFLQFQRNGKIWYVGANQNFTLVKYSEKLDGKSKQSKQSIITLLREMDCSSSIYDIIRPTCSLFIAAWNILRLTSTRGELNGLDVRQPGKHFAARDFALRSLNESPDVKSRIVNYVAEEFDKNESEAATIIKGTDLVLNEGEIKNEYY